MKTIILSVLLAITGLECFADNTNQVFTGNWSDAVGGLRMRFIVTAKQGRDDFRRGVVYLEMDNVVNCINPIEFPSGFSLNCTLTNSIGNPPPPAGGMANGPICPPFWIYVPFDSTLKLRVDDIHVTAFGYKGKTGVSLAVGSGCWLVPDNTTNDFFLSGTFRVDEARQTEEHIHAWYGTISIPRVKINFHK